MLAAYRKLHVPPAIRASAWERLQVAIEDEQAEPSIAYRRRKGAGWAVALLTAAALLLVFAGLRRMAGPASGTPDHSAAQDSARDAEPVRTTSRDADEPSAPSPVLPTPELTPDPVPEPTSERRTRPSERPAQGEPADSTLQAELSLLRAARAALARKDAATALRLLADHAARFPRGHLSEERMVLRAQALCEHGDRDEARAAVEQLLRAYPQSPNAATLANCQGP